MLTINALKMIPKPPHKVEPFDGLLVRVNGALPDQPIADAYAVDADGKIDLGPTYGRIDVAGKTIDEVKDALVARLKDILEDPEVSVSLAFSGGANKSRASIA